MRKWLTEPDQYVCELSPETQKVALEELREDKSMRDQALESLRNWIIENPRILNCRLDSKFLLRFLRFKKFSLVQAQECIERYLLLRHTYDIIFQCLDITIPTMEELIDIGYLFACPKRDSKNRRVIITRPGVFDPYKYLNADMCRIHGIVYETLMEDEENQIHGFVHFGDGSGVGFTHLMLFTPRDAVRIAKNGERTLPMRHKEIHAINVPTPLKFAFDFATTLVSEKIRKRVKVYTNVDDAIKNGVERDILPKEYGGIMPMSEMITLFKKELFARRDLILSHDEMKVNWELFSEKEREGAVSALKHKNCGRNVGDVMCGVSGSFRKLEVD